MCFTFSCHYQMSLQEGPKLTSLKRSPVITTRCHKWGIPRSDVWGEEGFPRSDVQGESVPHLTFSQPYLAFRRAGGTPPCDLSHDAFDATYPHVNRQTPVKTLPVCNFASLFLGGWPLFYSAIKQEYPELRATSSKIGAKVSPFEDLPTSSTGI